MLAAVLIAAFWFPEPSRVRWLWLLVPLFGVRLLFTRRVTAEWMSALIYIIFIILSIVNVNIAPYTYGSYISGRAIMGAAVAISITAWARALGSIKLLVWLLLALCLLVGVLGLGSAQYTVKSSQIQFLVDMMPEIRGFPGAERGFNVNEIGGAMSWLAPVAAGIMIFDWRERRNLIRRWVATLAFVVLALAIFLGQSRMSIVGVVVVLAGLIWLLIPTIRWRVVAYTLLAAFVAVQIGLLAGVFGTPDTAETLAERDTDSLESRLRIFESAVQIIGDYPLTGAGINQFRSRPIRAAYPVDGYLPGEQVLPHAHNELLHMGADMGIPGMVLYIAWNGLVLWQLYRAWRDGEPFARAVAASLAAGLVAHHIFGLADAITLFDRFVYVYWVLLGAASGVYVVTRHGQPLAAESPDESAASTADSTRAAIRVSRSSSSRART